MKGGIVHHERRRLKRPAVLVLLLAAIAGCSDPVETPPLEGEWAGSTRDGADHWTFRFEAAGNPHSPTGTLELSAGGTARGTFSGTYDHPALTLHIRVTVDGVDPPVEHPAEYHATVSEERNGMEGTMVIEDRTYPLRLSRTR